MNDDGQCWLDFRLEFKGAEERNDAGMQATSGGATSAADAERKAHGQAEHLLIGSLQFN